MATLGTGAARRRRRCGRASPTRRRPAQALRFLLTNLANYTVFPLAGGLLMQGVVDRGSRRTSVWFAL
jgi:hypothetical protein